MTASATDDWLEECDSAFVAVKEYFNLGRTWTFSIDSVVHRPEDVDLIGLDDEKGAAAFMLRRIQAVRYILTESDSSLLPLALGYASDLGMYLSELVIRKKLAEDSEIPAFDVTTLSLIAELSEMILPNRPSA